MYLKLTNLILFTEKNYKKQSQMSHENHSVEIFCVTYSYDKFCNLILRNLWTWTWKISDSLTGFGLTLWYNGLGLRKYLNYLTGHGLIFVGVRLEKLLEFPVFGLILWYIQRRIQTVLFEVELIVDNAPLTCVYPNAIETCLTSNHLLFVIIFF